MTRETLHYTTKIVAEDTGMDLAVLLPKLGVNKPLPIYERSFPSLNPIDIFRSSITEELARITQLDSTQLYPALEWANTLDKGDLLLAVPRLRLKGVKPEEKASEWAAQVLHRLPF